ncbi:MAG: flavodoxin family protein [Treponemataceae bacterium]|nr:MAG: flavodoxin family protein [Treponemataceae bacterium]
MNIEVRYLSKSGNTEKLAKAIAEAAGVSAKSVSAGGVSGEVDLLFLGGALYAFSLASELKAFIESLDAAKIKKAAVFATSAGVKSVTETIKKALQAHGIKIVDYEDGAFYCQGEFKFFNKGRPNEDDLARAKKFAAGVIDVVANG